MAITKVINDAVDLNQASDYSGLRLPVGTTGDITESFTTDYLVVAGGGGGGYLGGGGGAGGLRTSYNNSTTTTNTLGFPSGKTAIATYMLDNNATDISGNYNGTETNITYNTGQYGGAAVFNGSSSKIDTGISSLSSPFAVSMWINEDVLDSGHFFSNWNSTSSDMYWQTTSDGRLRISIDGFSQQFFGTAGDVTINTWHHIAVTLSSGSYEVYLDGNSLGTSTTSVTTFSSGQNFMIGNSSKPSTPLPFDGLIDQVRIYDSALSSTNVTNIYNNEVQALSGGGSAAESSLTLETGTSYDVTVGAGGTPGATSNTSATLGGNSIFTTVTSTGGGGGGNHSTSYAQNGGSGGGANSSGASRSGGNGTLNQGYGGGANQNTASGYGAGGGGSAKSIGINGTSTSGGNGGFALPLSITGTSTNYAGGGGGGVQLSSNTAGTGGGGGAGDGSNSSTIAGEAALFNTGSGGGGGGYTSGVSPYGSGGTGGSGVVILRYPTASVSSFTTTGTLNTPSTTDTLADNNYPVTNVAYYKLDGNANGYLTTNDLGTVNYPAGAGCIALYEMNGNATDTSNTYNGSATDVTYNTGAFDQAAVFNGTSSKIGLDSSISSTFTDSFTFSAWVYPTDNSNYICLFSAQYGMELYFYQGEFSLYSNDTNTGSSRNIQNFATTTTNYAINQWHHVALVFTKTSQTWYINGQQDGTNTTSSYTPYQSSLISIGYFDASTNHYVFNGLIDQVRVFNTALSASNVATLARGAGTAYNGIATNVTWTNGRFSQAADFSGSVSYINTGYTRSGNEFAFSMWVNASDIGARQYLLADFNSTGATVSFSIACFIDASDDINIYIGDGTNFQNSITTGFSSYYGKWTHIALSIASDGKTATLYLDNNKTIGTAVTNAYQTGQNPIGLGHWGGSPSSANEFTGLMDQVRIYSTALSDSNVTDLYNEHYQTQFTDGSDTAILFTEGTGTVTFSSANPTPPQGAIRTNTSYSEDGSASAIEHYNGTEWKYFDAIKYCTTNTLNFPSGAGCVASYNLDNNVDDIGNTYNGLNSAVTFNASGKFGAAAVFNGSSSKIDIDNLIPTDINASLSMWVKSPEMNLNNTTVKTIFYNRNPYFIIYRYGGNWLFVIKNSSSANSTVSYAVSNFNNNQWYHLAATSSGVSGTMNFYVNGISVGTTSAPSSILNVASSAFIGSGANAQYFNGSIDQVRIFNDSLTSDEVSKLYNNEVACS